MREPNKINYFRRRKYQDGDGNRLLFCGNRLFDVITNPEDYFVSLKEYLTKNKSKEKYG